MSDAEALATEVERLQQELERLCREEPAARDQLSVWLALAARWDDVAGRYLALGPRG